MHGRQFSVWTGVCWSRTLTPLKDAVGYPGGKADKLYLYLCPQKLLCKVGGAPITTHHCSYIFYTHWCVSVTNLNNVVPFVVQFQELDPGRS